MDLDRKEIRAKSYLIAKALGEIEDISSAYEFSNRGYEIFQEGECWPNYLEDPESVLRVIRKMKMWIHFDEEDQLWSAAVDDLPCEEKENELEFNPTWVGSSSKSLELAVFRAAILAIQRFEFLSLDFPWLTNRS
jgi:hypothetical protein